MASDQGSNGRISVNDGDVKSQAESSVVHTALRRKLKNRHVAMIRYSSVSTAPSFQLIRASSIGGVIGTGLFFGTATSLRDAGPLGILLVYVFIGSICVATMVSPCLHQFQERIVLRLITALSR